MWDFILFEKIRNYQYGFNKKIKTLVESLSEEPQLVNDGLYCNYCDVAQYYDDNFHKTASFLDSISLAET